MNIDQITMKAMVTSQEKNRKVETSLNTIITEDNFIFYYEDFNFFKGFQSNLE